MTEREAFEREFKTRWEIGHFILKMVKFVDESQDYAPVNAVKQLSDEYYWVLALNTGWWAWQAARAQAIPDGFVVVPVSASEKTKQKMLKVFNESDKFLNCENMYKAMIEAQEQTHD